MKLFAFTFLCLLGTVSLSQNSISYTKADGLPTNDVYQIISASDRTLWMATENGLVNYDGYNFSVFTKKDGLSHNENFEVFENAGNIHCLGAEGGFSTGNDREEFNHQNLFKGFISEMLFEQDLTVAASFGGGIMIMSETDTVLVETENGLPDMHVSFIWKWDENIYCISKSGLSRVSKEGSVEVLHTFEKRIHFARGLQLKDQVIFDDGSRLFSFNKEEELTPIQIDFPVSQRIVTKVQYLDGLVFFSSYAGTHAYEFHDNELIYHSSYEADKITTSICKDYQGAYWVSTLKDGVCRISHSAVYRLFDHQTFGISIYKNEAFIGDQNFVLNRYSPFGQNQISFNRNNKGPLKIRKPKFINDQLWIENDGALALYSDGAAEYFRTGEAVVTDYQGQLIIGTKSGAYIINQSDLPKISFSRPEGNLIKDLFDPVFEIAVQKIENAKEKVIFGTAEGAFFYDGIISKSNVLPNAKVLDIDTYESLVAITYEEFGTYVCSPTDTFLLYPSDARSGLATCADISEKFLAVGTLKGVYCFDAESYDKLQIHYLPNTDIRDIEVLNDEMIFSTELGVYKIELNNILEFDYEINLTISSIKANDRLLELARSEYDLAYDENRISIDARTVNFSSNRARLYYSVNGEKDQEFDGTLILEELSPGPYEVVIYARDDFKTSEQINLSFYVNPPWWKTWWFALCLFLVFIVMVWSFFKIRVLTYNRDVVREIMLAFRNRVKKDRFVVVKDVRDGSKVKIALSKVLVLKSAKNYVDIQLENEKITVRSTFKNLIEQFEKVSPGLFVQVHKSYVINIQKVKGVHSDFITINELQIPIGNNYKKEIQSLTKEHKS